jgi:hypothetical protein
MPAFRHSLAPMVLFSVLPSFLFGQQQSPKSPGRDAQSVEILMRASQAAGGTQALAAVHNITEIGEVTYYWRKDEKGRVEILMRGSHFRMEADLPEGKRTWLIKAGAGSIREPRGNTHPLSYDNAANLENLTFPIAHVVAALTDTGTDISFVGIENENEHSVYRIRVKGQLGLSGSGPGLHLPVVKDLIIDALTFGVVRVEDRPIRTYEKNGKPSDKPSRVIEYRDFRTVDGISVPFSITTQLMGQKTLSIELSSVTFDSDTSAQDLNNN